MLKEVAEVVTVEPDGLWVATERQTACQKCQAQRGCGQKLLSKSLGETTYVKAIFETEVDSQRAWAVGQEVVIGIEEQAFLSASVVAYLFPLVLMMLSMFIAHYLLATELAAILGAVLGLFVGGALVKLLGSRASNRLTSCFQIKVISQVNFSQPHLIASE